MKMKHKGFTLIELIIAIMFVFIVILVVVGAIGLILGGSCVYQASTQKYQDIQVESEARDHAVFEGWVKVNGNPKDLTFEQWQAMRDSKVLISE